MDYFPEKLCGFWGKGVKKELVRFSGNENDGECLMDHFILSYTNVSLFAYFELFRSMSEHILITILKTIFTFLVESWELRLPKGMCFTLSIKKIPTGGRPIGREKRISSLPG